jgi:hypothetical protein
MLDLMGRYYMEFANLRIHPIFSDGQLDTRQLAEKIFSDCKICRDLLALNCCRAHSWT